MNLNHNTITAPILNYIDKNNKLTGVSGTGKKRSWPTKVARAILISSKANRIPIQFLGPIPKGIQVY